MSVMNMAYSSYLINSDVDEASYTKPCICSRACVCVYISKALASGGHLCCGKSLRLVKVHFGGWL